MQEVLLQTAKIVGNYEVKASLKYNNEMIDEIEESQGEIKTLSKNIHPIVAV